MKNYLLLSSVMAVLSLSIAPLIAQDQTSYVQTSKIIGKTIKTERGEEVGVVKDIVLDQSSGCLAYTVVSTGGMGSRITGQAKTVAVPWSVYSVGGPDVSVVTVRVERDRIYNAPVFEYSRIREYQTTGYINNVYSHFGVSAQVGGSRTTSTSTSTAATTNPQPTASQTPLGTPGATQSPAPTQSPGPTQSIPPTQSPAPAATSPAASAPPEATPAGSPKAGASPAPTRGRESGAERSKKEATPSSSRRHPKASPSETSEESATESPSSKGKKSSRKPKTPDDTEPAATPESAEQPPQ